MRKTVLIVAAVAAVVAAAVALPFVATIALDTIASVAGGCSEGEKRVFREFTQYDGRQLEPEYNGSTGCFVAFTTEDPAEDVRTYYREQLTARGWKLDPPPPSVEAADDDLLRRYVAAFEQYDMEALTALIREDATQSMPPFDLWLAGRDDILTWWFGPGNGCRGSRVIPVRSANGAPAFGQYKPAESGEGYEPWALQVVEIENDRIVELTFFLDVERLFPRFGLPLDYAAR